MDKKIEDYLHLYFGCDLLIDKVYPGFTCKLVAYNPTNSIENGITLNMALHESYQAKPILRPLSDMTADECRHICDLAGYSENEGLNVDKQNGIWRKSINLDSWYVYDDCYARDFPTTYPIENSRKIFLYLLKQGFDLFGLIDAGLAISKVEVSNPLKTE